MRKTISSTPVRTGVVFMLFPVLFMVYALYITFTEGFSQELLLLFLLPAIFGLISLYLLTKIKNVEYDTEYMYIVSRKYEIEISFDEITRARMTSTGINKWNIWRISYTDNDGSISSVDIYPKGYVKELDEFFLRLWQNNNSVEIDHWLPPDQRDVTHSG